MIFPNNNKNTLSKTNNTAEHIDYEKIVDTQQTAIAVVGYNNSSGLKTDFFYTYINNQYANIFNTEKNKCIGKLFYKIHPNAEDYWHNLAFNALNTNKTIKHQEYSITADKYLYITFQPLSKNQVIISFIDITKLKKAEFKAIDRQQKIESFFEAAPVGFGIACQRQITEANQKLCNITGYNANELVGKNTLMLYANIGCYHLVEQAYKKLEYKNSIEIELKWKRKDNSLIDVLLCMSPVKTQKQNKTVAFAIYDISRRKNAERNAEISKKKLQKIITKYIESNSKIIKINNELKTAKQKLEDSLKLKTAFLQNISHEVRTPMNAIFGFSQLIERHSNNEQLQKKFVDIVYQHGTQLIELLDEIVELSLIETNQIVPKIVQFNINSLFTDIYEKTHHKLITEAKTCINLTCKYANFNQTITTDPTKLSQIFYQLTKNAVKYSTNGTICFGLHAFNNNTYTFFVADNGIGIENMNIDSIFEKFRQIEFTDQTRKGLGIGLTIAKELVKMLNGQIWVESAPGKGSIFYFSINT